MQSRKHSTNVVNRTGIAVLLLAVALLLAGCGLFGGAQESPTPMPTRTPFPTFTPTATSAPLAPAATNTPEPPAAAAPAQPAPAAGVTNTAATTATGATTATAGSTAASTGTITSTQTAAQPLTTTAQAAAPAGPSLTIASDVVNVRSGPGTEFDVVGAANNGQSFRVVGKNTAGDWWEVCCINGKNGWVFGQLASTQNTDAVAVAADLPAEPTPAPTSASVAAAPADATPAPAAPAAPYDPNASSAGNFDPNAQYQIVHFKVLGLDENNGGIRSSSAQHLIFLTVLDQNGNGVDGAVVRNLVGDKKDITTGTKGPGKAEITMYYEPFKLTVASDPSGSVTSQVSNQMGLVFPHLPDLVGKLGDVNYEYGACPTLEIKCQWPIKAIHFSYEITFQKVK